ncbi:MAG TPA: DUF1330 domain-containing protein [Acidimicrobiia bacterium]|nr:DUF1330 domain-containing protein [Acidimicrobiia bacterium]
MSHYAVLLVTPSSEDWIAEYIADVPPLVKKHGGQYLARTASQERLEGTGDHPAMIGILEFPSKEAAEAFYNDPEYKPHLQARLAGANNDLFLVEGKDDFA